MSNFWSAVFGFISGIIASMGMGGGSMLIICLTIFQKIPQHIAQGINLIFFIPIAATATIYYSIKKLISWKYALILTILGVIGSLIGAYFSAFINALILKKIFGIFLLLLGITQLFKKS